MLLTLLCLAPAQVNAQTPVGIAVGGDNLTRLLWNNPDGSTSLWKIAADGSVATQNSYGPYTGWSGKSLAAGTDNVSRILWTNTSRAVALWRVNGDGSFTNSDYGPYSGWNGLNVAVGGDNVSRILWTNTSGQMALWSVAADGTYAHGEFGPYTAYTAFRVAAGPNSIPRTLWNKTDGSISLWYGTTDMANFASLDYGPFAGYTPAALAVDSTNAPRIVWNHPSDRTVDLWKVTGNSVTNQTFPDPAGYSPVALAAGTGGELRLLWGNGQGGAVVWTIAAGGTYTSKTYPIPVLTSIVLSPASATMNVNGTQQFTAVGKDQNGNALSPQPAFTWSVASGDVGSVSSGGLYSAGSSAGSATVKAASGTVTGTAAVTVTVTEVSGPDLTLTAAATGANKVMLYWNGIAGASGYNVYRATVSGGSYSLIASNVMMDDPGVGMTNAFMYSDSVGLVSGTEYFYIVTAILSGVESVQSNENSATPDSSAIPWDTGDAAQIIAAVNATALNDLEPDIDEYGTMTPQQVGPLFVSAPDGVLYLGNMPDTAPQVYAGPGHIVGDTLVSADEIVIPIPDDTSDSSSTSSVSADDDLAPFSDSFLLPRTAVLDNYPYQSTNPPTGIYRKVESSPGFAGLDAIIGLPAPYFVNLVNHPSTIAPAPGAVTRNFPTVGDIYSGGTVYSANGSRGSELDAGLQLIPGNNPGGFGQEWTPIVFNHYRSNPATQNNNKSHPATADKVYVDGSAHYLAVGNQPGALIYKTILRGTVRMQLLTPKFASVRDQSVRLHFSVPPPRSTNNGDNGYILLNEYYPNISPPQRKKQLQPQYLTLEYFGVIGWHKSSYKFVIKRVNSLAQTLNAPNTLANPSHPGAPVADSPVSSTTKGWLADGSYINASAPSSPAGNGAFWGLGLPTDVRLYDQIKGWQPWNQDSVTTGRAGSYPAKSLGGPVYYGNFYNTKGASIILSTK